MNCWHNRVAVVTGAASGIGAQVVKDFLDAGLIVAGLDILEEKMCSLKDNFQPEKKKRFHPLLCDVNNKFEVERSFDRITKELGGVDILVNSAGIHYYNKMVSADVDIMKKVLDTNVMSSIHCTQLAYKSMKSRNFDGYIFFLNSISGHIIPQSSSIVSNVYSPSKHALTVVNEIFRQEFRDNGTRIKVTNICPGLTDTEMVLDDYKAKLGDTILKTEDISKVIMFIINLPPHVQIHDIIIKSVGDAM